jgi:hypothetical protein
LISAVSLNWAMPSSLRGRRYSSPEGGRRARAYRGPDEYKARVDDLRSPVGLEERV